MKEQMTVDTKLRVLRIGRKWSQDHVAEKLDITQAAYAKLEAGKTRLTIDRAKQLADLYEIEPEFFLSDIASVIHANKGIGSNSNSGYIQIYNNEIIEDKIKLYEKIISEKEAHIKFLNEQLKEYIKKERQLISLLEKIAIKP